MAPAIRGLWASVRPKWSSRDPLQTAAECRGIMMRMAPRSGRWWWENGYGWRSLFFWGCRRCSGCHCMVFMPRAACPFLCAIKHLWGSLQRPRRTRQRDSLVTNVWKVKILQGSHMDLKIKNLLGCLKNLRLAKFEKTHFFSLIPSFINYLCLPLFLDVIHY